LKFNRWETEEKTELKFRNKKWHGLLQVSELLK